ncbi:hypothetical protein BJ165DRAFT_654714 [Panaeolus papilionaceus]|nr:hypothetical protein BJ165DRAFT_654714 [Panaeolus papilionaceus]
MLKTNEKQMSNTRREKTRQNEIINKLQKTEKAEHHPTCHHSGSSLTPSQFTTTNIS